MATTASFSHSFKLSLKDKFVHMCTLLLIMLCMPCSTCKSETSLAWITPLLCVCVCVCVCAYACVCVRARLRTCMSASQCLCLYLRVYAREHAPALKLTDECTTHAPTYYIQEPFDINTLGDRRRKKSPKGNNTERKHLIKPFTLTHLCHDSPRSQDRQPLSSNKYRHASVSVSSGSVKYQCDSAHRPLSCPPLLLGSIASCHCE